MLTIQRIKFTKYNKLLLYDILVQIEIGASNTN